MTARILALTEPDIDPDEVDHLHTEISRTLSEIGADSVFLRDLHDTSAPGLGFLTPTAMDRMDDGIRADQEARAARHASSHILLREGTAPVHGYTAAPGRVPAISLTGEITAELHRLARTLVTHLARHGICTLHQAPHAATVARLVGYLRRLAMDVHTPSPLAAVLESLDHIALTLRDHLAGERQSLLPGTCPHCGRVTLVVYFADQLVRCERERINPRRAGRLYQPCVCPDPLCHCKADALAPRHTWHLNKPRSAPDSYAALQRHLNPESLTPKAQTRRSGA